MDKIKENYKLNEFSNILAERLLYATYSYNKSIVEFNPTQNNYFYGYLSAIRQINEDFNNIISKGEI